MPGASKVVDLKCINCRKSYPIDSHFVCGSCGSILTTELELNEPINLQRLDSMWQFREYFAPVDDSNIVSMGEGWTPLIPARTLAEEIGLKKDNLICKMEGQNATGSFKDRAASVSVSLAKQWKKKGVFLASSGNAAAATAGYCARANIGCLVLLKEQSTVSKLSQISMYNPLLIRVKDLYKDAASLDAAFRLSQEALPAWINGFIWARYNPLDIDALKTISYELAASHSEPDYIFVPTAGGDLMFGLYKGFKELEKLGQIERVPKLVVVQGAYPSPSVDEVEGQKGRVGSLETTKSPERTIAGALSSNMVSDHGVYSVRETGGFGVRVTNDEIVKAQRLAAKSDGIFCEASSAVTLAAVEKALKEGRIGGDEKVCTILTGTGFKDYYPPLGDLSQIPFADSVDSIRPLLASLLT